MQAVILAGGLGTRLRPLTDKVPKVMVRVRGREFLWHLVSWLGRNDVREVVICAGYLSEAIARKLKSCPFPAVKIRLSVEEQPLGTAGAVKNAEALLAEEFMIVNGDTYLPISYRQIFSRWQQIKGEFDSLLVVYSNAEKIAPNDTALDEEGVATGYSKRDCQGMQYVNAGIVVVKKSIFQPVPPGVPVSLEEEVFPELIRRRKMAALITDERYYDIGSPERLRAFEEYVDKHPEVLLGQP